MLEHFESLLYNAIYMLIILLFGKEGFFLDNIYYASISIREKIGFISAIR